MRSMNSVLVIAALTIITQVCLMGRPPTASAIYCPSGYKDVGGRCVKATTFTSTGTMTWVDGELGSLNYTSDPLGNAFLYQLVSAPKFFDFETTIDNIVVTTALVEGETDVYHWRISSTNNAVTPDWLSGDLVLTVTPPAFPEDLSIYAFTGNLETFIRARTFLVPGLERPADLVMNGDIAYGIEFDSQKYDFLLAPVPEPSTLLLLGGGFAGLAGAGVRRRIKNQRKS